MNKWGLIVLAILVSAGVSIACFKIMEHNFHPVPVKDKKGQIHFVSSSSVPDSDINVYPDLSKAAAIATRQVVHIKVQINKQAGNSGTFGPEYYGAPQQQAPVMASGSGVIFSTDGYIITNNHVVEDATQIEVILNDKRTFSAKLVGRDPNTDLALIKINASGLSAVKLGNSDQVQIGQWVLAIGYPLSLNTTVTAGIVSAKERNIGIIGQHEQQSDENTGSSAIEAYIQTDAAINPGNSGGALVNTHGELIGINAAIASQTGGYEGYGFSIPINLARKIVTDLKNYGTVKRGYLGVVFPSPATETQELKQRGIDPGSLQGIYVTSIHDGSAAALAGLKEGDVIQQIDGQEVNSSVELSERIARHHPQDKVSLKYLRNGKVNEAFVTLQAQSSAQKTLASGPSINDIYNKLGARFAPLSQQIKDHYQINSGMLVTAVARGGFFEQVGIRPGSIVVGVNGAQVNNPLELNKALTNATTGTIRIACITPERSRVMFNLSLGT